MNDMTSAAGTDLFAQLPLLPAAGYATHEVLNQATLFAGHNAFGDDRLLIEIAARGGISRARGPLSDAGRTVASATVAKLARDANRHLPELRTHDLCL